MLGNLKRDNNDTSIPLTDLSQVLSIILNVKNCYVLQSHTTLALYGACLESFKTVTVSQSHLYALQ